MIRSCRLSLKFLTEEKRKKLNELLCECRLVLQHFTDGYVSGEYKGLTDNEVTKLKPATPISARYVSAMQRQAKQIFTATKASRKALKKGYTEKITIKEDVPLILDDKFFSAEVDPDNLSFDVVGRLSTLTKGKKLPLVMRATRPLRKWVNRPGAVLKGGCRLSNKYIDLFVEVPTPEKKNGRQLGVDVGINQLISTSDGQQVSGDEFKRLRDRIGRCKAGSKNKRGLLIARDRLLNRAAKQIPYDEISLLVAEDIKGMKTGKSKKRGKKFRKAMIPWSYRRLLCRMELLCEENGVLFDKVDPAYTSQTCTNCGSVSPDNRIGEKFCCKVCGHTAHADTYAAEKILMRSDYWAGEHGVSLSSKLECSI